MTPAQIEFYKRLAHGLALQFGPNCEIVVHDLEADDLDHSIVAIENGHISGRRLGDGPSHVVLEALNDDADELHDRPPYLTKTEDGKLLKSSTIFIRDDAGWPRGILAINFDITLMTAFSNTLGSLIGTVVGVVLGGIVGILIMPLIGAAIGEFWAKRDLLHAGRVGLATWIGMIIGTVVKVALAFTMTGTLFAVYFL